jgi:hypothetical protein
MRQLRVRISFCLVLLIVALSAVAQQAATSSDAVVPPLINFSGTLTDINGKPLTSIVGVTFSLYNDQQAASPLWMETQNVTPAKNGRYSVELGSTSSIGLPADIFVAGEARWLGVQPQGQAEYPRVMLLSVPYALKAGDAQTIGGLPPSAFLLAPSAAGTTSSTRTASSTPLTSGPVTGSGTVNFLPLWDGTSDIISSALFQSGSAPTAMIGINTATPSATLDLATGDVLLEAGNLDLPQTTSATNGVITLGGVPFIYACCSSTSFNTYVGTNAGNFNTLSVFSTVPSYNTAVGYKALTTNTGNTNTAVGTTALTANTTGNSNTAVGTSSLQLNTTGSSNTAVGTAALEQTGVGSANTAVGDGAGLSNTGGSNNTFVGQGADAGSQTLTNATAIGSAAIVNESNALVLGAPGVKVGIGTATPGYSLDVQGNANFTGIVTFAAPGQTFPGTGNGTVSSVGSGAGLAGGPITSSGTLSIAPAGVTNAMLANPSVTVSSGPGLTGGGTVPLGGTTTLSLDTTQVPMLNTANLFTGNQTVNGNLSATGLVTGSGFQIGSNLFAFGSYTNYNVFVGFSGNATVTGQRNTASGYQSLYSDTTGYANTASGVASLYNNTTGSGNTGAGGQALGNNTTGVGNTGTGYSALYKSTTGTGNTGTGFDALPFNTTGTYNTGVGFQAGAVVDTSDMSGQLNTFLGAETAAGSGTFNNATAVGAYAEVGGSNALVLGSIAGVNNCTAANSCASTNVGIGTTTPAYTLDVHGTANFTGIVNFAANQTFPGNGTVTSVGSGAGLTGGPITSTGTLSIAPAGVTNAMLANPSLTVSAGPGLTGGGAVALGGATTLSLDTTQVPFLVANNTFTGNQTVNGNLSATGFVTGSGFQIGSSLFDYGSYSNGNAFLGFAGNGSTSAYNNTATGVSALTDNTTGSDNTADGLSALRGNVSGSNNTASGLSALFYNTSGSNNTGLGYQAGLTVYGAPMTTNNNTFLGANTTALSGTLANATAIGANAEVDASNSLVLGAITGWNNCTAALNCASVNVGIGTTKPLYTLDVHGTANFTGLVNFAANQTFPGIGTITGVTTAAGSGLTGGATSGNATLSLSTSCGTGQILQWNGSAWACSTMSGGGTITGVTSGTGLTGGGGTGNVTLNVDPTQVPFLVANNTFTGNQTVNGNLSATGMVTGSGFQIGSNLFDFGSYANGNAFLGFAGNTTSSGSANTASGWQALLANTAGYANTASGAGSLSTNNTGYGNTSTGATALAYNTTGYGNTGIGRSALFSNMTGSLNTGVGYLSGSGTSGQNNTFLGASTATGSGTFNNATAVGAYAEVGASNSLVLGSIADVNNCTASNNCASVNVGIGTTTPQYTLDVNGTANFTGLVKFAGNQPLITGVTTPAGSGLTGGATSGDATLSLSTSCGTGQILQWNGSAWVCAVLVGGGTITGVTGGTGLTGSGTSGNVTLNADPTQLPFLVANNTFTGNETVNGNVSATGMVTGSAFNIGSNLFAFGSYANNNVFLGFSGNTTTTGQGNTATGFQALNSNAGGLVNTATGFLALYSNQSGNNDAATGSRALTSNTTGIDNTAMGTNALLSNTTGGNNTATGSGALYYNTTGNFNTATGYLASGANITGSNNAAFGFEALLNNTAGTDNTASGYEALYSNTGSYNTASGSYALHANTTGTGNTASGDIALFANTTGSSNTASGEQALLSNTTGSSNTATGFNSLLFNSTGSLNTASGFDALTNNTTGSSNTATGERALVYNTAGAYNTAIGDSAGLSGDGSYVTGSNNAFLGAASAMSTGTLTNTTAIGANAEVAESNAMVLGSINGVNNATANTNVGIGTTTPAYTLDVHGTGNFTGLVTFAPTQTFPGTGTGTVTGVTTTKGGGLMGGGTSGSVALGLTNSCASGQVLQWGGAAWVCSTISGGGTITGVNAGTDLLGGGSSGVVGLALDTTKVPQLATPNSFAGTQTIAGNLALTGSGNGVQFPDGTLQTTAATGGSGVPSGFMILGSTSTVPSGYTLSGMTTSGNVAVSLAPMITPRYDMGVTVANGKIYASGGQPNGQFGVGSNANEVFDPTSNTWTSMAAVKTQSGVSKLVGAAAFTVNGEPCLMGGESASRNGTTIVTNSVECFSTSSDAWSPFGVLVTGTYDMAAVVVPTKSGITFSGDVLSIGGHGSGAAFLNTIEYYSSGAWAAAATTLPTARAQLAAVIDTTADKLYAIGGYNSTSSALSIVEVLDLTTGLWSTAAPLSAPRRGLSAVYLNGKIYAIGGFNGSSIVSTVEVYDPTSNTWTTVPFPGRQLFGAVVLNNLIYLVGGQDGANVLGSTEQYSPPVTLYTFTKN